MRLLRRSDCRTKAGLLYSTEDDGAHARIRTGDLFLTKEMLYRLSYVGGAALRFYLLDTDAQFHATHRSGSRPCQTAPDARHPATGGGRARERRPVGGHADLGAAHAPRRDPRRASD